MKCHFLVKHRVKHHFRISWLLVLHLKVTCQNYTLISFDQGCDLSSLGYINLVAFVYILASVPQKDMSQVIKQCKWFKAVEVTVIHLVPFWWLLAMAIIPYTQSQPFHILWRYENSLQTEITYMSSPVLWWFHHSKLSLERTSLGSTGFLWFIVFLKVPYTLLVPGPMAYYFKQTSYCRKLSITIESKV